MEAGTVGVVLSGASNFLLGHGCETARLDAEVLLAFIKNCSRTALYIGLKDEVSPDLLLGYKALLQRRASGEPVAYIVGEKEFRSLNFIVNRHVLIPRPETELIIEEALEVKPLSAIDVGTGSGAISVSLAYYLPECHVSAVDISSDALEVARKNAAGNGVLQRIKFYCGNLLGPVIDAGIDGVELITANLPYIPSSEIAKLPVDVRQFEPALALDGGKDGLDYYYELSQQALKVLAPDGIILLEIGYDQGEILPLFLKENGYDRIEVIKDYAGLDRVVKARRGHKNGG